MPKTHWQDPGTSEILSTHIAGLQEAIGKIEDALNLSTVAETNVTLTEVFISESDRYRVYQASGKRNWLASPAPVVRRNGTAISTGFSIDYGGGAVIFHPPLGASDVVTADFTRLSDAPDAVMLKTILSAAGDILFASAANTPARLAKGTARQVLAMNSAATAPEWVASPQSVMTTAGDIIYASAANTMARLAKGTARQVLAMNSDATAPEWIASLQSLMTAEGDTVIATAANTPARLARGSAGQFLRINSGGTRPEWSTPYTMGTSTFAGSSTARTIAHDLGVIPTVVMITPSANPGGFLGEVWYTADATNISVFNSGTAVTGFAWVAYR